MIQLSKCSDKACESAFQKGSAKQKTKLEEKGQGSGGGGPQSIRGHSTRRYWHELRVGSGSHSRSGTEVVTLRLINNTLRQHQGSQAGPLHLWHEWQQRLGGNVERTFIVKKNNKIKK